MLVSRRFSPARIVILALVFCAALVGGAGAGDGVASGLRQPTDYGLWVLAPAGAAIVCAVITRQVIPSLLMGVVVAAGMLISCASMAEVFPGDNSIIRTARITIEHYVIDAIRDTDHVKVMMFSLIIGGMVGVINANGGTRAMVKVIARHANTRVKGQLACWFAGLVVFFDDYANTMIVGPTMQPICDRLGVSRAKLSYIVDSTAAPVASIAVVGTWVGAEMGYIQDGLSAVAADGTPPFLAGVDKWQAFLNSIPYRFYPILAILLVFLIAVTGRDIGPMHRAERLAGARNNEGSDVEGDGDASTSGWAAWRALLPICVLIFVTFGVLCWPGLTDRAAGEPLHWRQVFDHPDTDAYGSILYGSILSAVTAVALTLFCAGGSLRAAMDGFVDGMSRMFVAIAVLILAWALSAASTDLMVGEVISGRLAAAGFAMSWLPVTVFFSAAVVSFATGTSWGTMGILCPVVVTVAARLGADAPAAEALPLFYASVGSVLAGAIFGDHCSPISDTTVLSSVASGCSLEEHVWTQIPYAILVAIVGMGCGDFLCAKLGLSPWVGIGAAIVIIGVIIRQFGRTTDDVRGA